LFVAADVFKVVREILFFTLLYVILRFFLFILQGIFPRLVSLLLPIAAINTSLTISLDFHGFVVLYVRPHNLCEKSSWTVPVSSSLP
jgi:hypothetical protein